MEKDTKQQAPDGYISLCDLIRTAYREDAAKNAPPPEVKERMWANIKARTLDVKPE